MGLNSLGCDVLLLAAGFGTRLRPLTDGRPKPLIEFCGKPIIEWNLELLARSGAKRVFINLHFMPEMIRTALGDGSRWGLEIEYIFEENILDTGGAIKNIFPYVQSDMLMTVNSDIIINPYFDMGLLVDFFSACRKKYGKLVAMLVLRECAAGEGKIGILEDGEICQVLDTCADGRSPVGFYEYTGVQILSRDIYPYMAPFSSVFSITRDLYKNFMSLDSVKVHALERPVLTSYIYEGFWTDLGTVDRLRAAEIEYGKLYGV